MNKNINKITAYLNVEKLKNDKRVVVFLICVFIATALWFLNALGKDYTTTISYPVKYVSAPNRQFLANEPPEELELKVEAHGFTLLRHKLSFSFSPIILNLTNITRNLDSRNGDYIIATNTIMRRISGQVSNEIRVQEVHPEIIQIVLDSLKTKSIEIKPDIELSFKPQFYLKRPLEIKPAEVKITGPATTVDTISFVLTEQRTFEELDKSVSKRVELLYPKGTTVVPSEVLLQIEVEKFTEKEIQVPVQIINKPVDVNVKLFPSEIKVSCMVGLSQFNNIDASDFRAVIDYKSIENTQTKLPVSIKEKPSFVELTRYSPESVEYLIETY